MKIYNSILTLISHQFHNSHLMLKSPFSIFLLLLFLNGCNKTEIKKEIINKKVNIDTKKEKIQSTIPTVKSSLPWDKLQDSLRTELLNQKDNEFLKSSILQELYLRNLVHQEKDSIHINIPFNLHEFDCSAPDCYTTHLKFSFKAEKKFQIPEHIPFLEFEQGCIPSSDTISGIFELSESNDNAVTFYNEKQQKLLIILKEDQRKEFAYYFIGVPLKSITTQTLDHFFEEFNEEDENALVPYRSSSLIKNDYWEFLD
ncbi:MAG: hypothetical protein KTR26_07455 [Flammeovirgaceae bacterium]|nr:hypothetical protein [Flammeovirgaceae bacterium]